MQSGAPFRSRLLAVAGAVALTVGSVAIAAAAGPRDTVSNRPSDGARPTWTQEKADKPSRLLVRFAPKVKRADRVRIGAALGLRATDRVPSRNLEVFDVPDGDLDAVRRALDARSDVLEVSTDDPLYPLDGPADEEFFPYQWGLHNTGQPIGTTGTSNVDIDGLQALALSTGDPSLVVAVIDDGVDYTHPDLAGRMWVNPGEIPDNGVDDDSNGIVDDVHGANFCDPDEPTGVPFSSNNTHGTHVAGTIAASLNGVGTVGVAPSVQIMALKFICGTLGSTSAAIKAIEYARDHGVRISNNSWGGGSFNTTLRNTIRDSGMLFVAAAGNGGFDAIGDNNDSFPTYPASYDAANILVVAAVDNRGKLGRFSNYGKTSVDISAPGVNVLSTIPPVSGCAAPCYAWADGTSMAAPHATGVAALAASDQPGLLTNPVALKARIMATGKPLSATVGKTVTGKIVDALYALDTTAPTSMAPTSHAFVVNSRLGTGIKTRIAWPAATDDLSGINFYAVQQQTNGGSWSTLMTANTTRSTDRSLKFGSTFRFQVRAKDRAGNYGSYAAGPIVQPRIFQEGTAAARYGGTWKTATSSTASGGKTRYATKAGAWVEYSFTGRGIAVVAPKSSGRGKAKVYIDGAYVKTVNAYRSSGQSKVVIFSKAWASSASHKIKLVVVGASGHPRFDIDAFVVLRQL